MARLKAMLASSANVEARPLHHAVMQDLVRRIVRHEFAPGQALPTEPVLAGHYGVSRTVLRDAVRALVARGLLAVRQGSGMRVRPPEGWDHLDPLILFEEVRGGAGEQMLSELLEVRRLVEVQAARWAAQRRTEADLRDLEAALEAMAAHQHDAETFTAHDVHFHELVLRAAANRLLRDTQRPIAAALHQGRTLTAARPEGVRQSLRGHQAIYQAIVDGDPGAAGGAMTEHLAQFEHDIRTALLAGE